MQVHSHFLLNLIGKFKEKEKEIWNCNSDFILNCLSLFVFWLNTIFFGTKMSHYLYDYALHQSSKSLKVYCKKGSPYWWLIVLQHSNPQYGFKSLKWFNPKQLLVVCLDLRTPHTVFLQGTYMFSKHMPNYQ